MKIYFDNVLIDEDAYAGLENTYKLFTDNFYLGSTASNTFKIIIAKTEVSSHPSEVKITDDTNTYYLIVDKVTDEKNFYIYELVDKLVLFNFNYDASVLIDERAEDELTTTLSDILTDMCSKVGIEIDENLTLINDITVTWYDNTLLARDYLGFIAELQGGFVRILNNGKLSVVGHNMSSQVTLNTGDVEEFIKSEEKTISKVVFDNGLVNWEAGDDTGNTLYLDPNNVYIVNEDIIGNIFNRVNGLNFWIGSITKCTLPNNIRAGDIITVLDGVTPYNIIVGYTSSYTDVNQIAMITNDVQTKQQETTQVIGVNTEIKSIKTIIDRTNASLNITAEKTDENETYISDIKLTPEEIRLSVLKADELDEDINHPTTGLSKKYGDLRFDVNKLTSEIGDVTDITTQEEGAGTLLFESINTSEPINITIRPTAGKDISYLYPSSRLFPSSSLFPQNRILRFYNSTEDETIDYLLPGNLRYLSPTVYDEFFLDFATTTCKITRKVAIAEDMTKSALAVPVEETYTYPNIPLSAGNYTVTMLGYPNAYMKIRLMSQNMYTSQFATRVELSSAITQSANAINLEVAKKVDETEVISSINLTSETATIDASKVDIVGVITAMNNDTTTTIDGDKITTGSITASQVSSGIITTSNLSAQNISATQITTGTLATARLNSDVITTTNFSAQNINADKITTGTISTDRLSSNVITTTNFSAQNINADKITTGKISTARLNSDVITTTNFSAQNINADNIKAGTLEGRAISGGSINIGYGKFAVNGDGTLSATGATISGTITANSGVIGGASGWDIGSGELTTKVSGKTATLYADGRLTFYKNSRFYVGDVGAVLTGKGTSQRCVIGDDPSYYDNAPAIATALANVPYPGNATGIPATVGMIAHAGPIMIRNRYSDAAGAIRLATTSSSAININVGTTDTAGAGGVRISSVGSATISGANVYLDAPTSGAVYARGYSTTSYQIVQAGGVYVSSRNLKTNIKKFEDDKYVKALKLLKDMDLYEYDYKYDLSANPHTFGFIIDEIEKLDKNEFFSFYEEKDVKIKDKALVYDVEEFKDNYDEKINIKRYDPSVLDKYLLTCIKAQQMKIDKLEKRIEKLEGKNGKTN